MKKEGFKEIMLRDILSLGGFNLKHLRTHRKGLGPLEFKHQESLPLLKIHRPGHLEHYFDVIEAGLGQVCRAWDLGNSVVDCLLPASFFEYSFQPENKGFESLAVKLDLGLQEPINKILERQGLEAAFLGSSLSAVIEFLMNQSQKQGWTSENIILIHGSYASLYAVGIRNGRILFFEEEPGLAAIEVDQRIQSLWDCAEPGIIQVKRSEIIFLPVFRQQQFQVPGFLKLQDYFTALASWIAEISKSILVKGEPLQEKRIFLSGGGMAFRNLEFFLQGTLQTEVRRLDEHFFDPILSKMSSISDSTNIFTPLYCHASEVDGDSKLQMD
jgi:hypothetical protein